MTWFGGPQRERGKHRDEDGRRHIRVAAAENADHELTGDYPDAHTGEQPHRAQAALAAGES